MDERFDTVGFLAAEMASWLQQTSPRGVRHIRLALDLSARIQADLYTVGIPRFDCHGRRDPRGPVLASLFVRTLSQYQATILLAQRGLGASAALTCRGLLEGMFKFFAIRRDLSALAAYILEDKHYRLGLAKNLSKHPEHFEEFTTTDDLERHTAELAQLIKADEIERPWKVWEWSDVAEMQFIYRSVYAILSSFTHSAAASLENVFVVGQDEDIESLRFEPHIDELVLTTASDYMIVMCEGFALEFNLDWTELLTTFRGRLQELIDDGQREAAHNAQRP